MQNFQVKSILFNLLMMLTLSILITSCEREPFIIEEMGGIKTEASASQTAHTDIESRKDCDLCLIPQVAQHPGPGCEAEWLNCNEICIEKGSRVLLRVLDCDGSIAGYTFDWSASDGGWGYSLENSGRPHRYTARAAGTYTVVVCEDEAVGGNPNCCEEFTFIVTWC